MSLKTLFVGDQRESPVMVASGPASLDINQMHAAPLFIAEVDGAQARFLAVVNKTRRR